jgi:23S rRNA (cytidine1920-2'-O)/16S rRNA (cytidine1409-2'-O)-methyltransferase
MIHMAKKQRVDQVLVERGMAVDLDEARRLVMAGKILLDGQLVFAPSQKISLTGELSQVQEPQFVSRGGDKLKAAFDAFDISVEGLVCADVGASTGGFTDCLLQRGAARVYAIDVGFGILDWGLRNDPRVIPLERTNARDLGKLSEPVDFITADVSFISLKMILPCLAGWYSEGGGQAVLLVKPQFEATKEESARGGGVISSPEIQRRVVMEVIDFASGEDFGTRGVIRSPLKGPAGNQEFLVWLTYPEGQLIPDSLEEKVNALF